MKLNTPYLLEKWQTFLTDYEGVRNENRERLKFFLGLAREWKRLAIDVIPLKGMDLLLRAYTSLGMRPMVDIDLLIRPRDIEHIQILLGEQGFKRKLDFEALSYVKPGTPLYLDIIWDIWYLPDTRAVWERIVKPEGVRPRTEGSDPIRFLHPEDSLLYLIVYGVAHRGSVSPAWVQDLNFLLQAEGSRINWERWTREVRCLKLVPAVFHGLSYAKNHGLDQVPEEVYRELTPDSLGERMLFSFYRKMVTEEGVPKVSYLLTWLEYPGLRGKLKLLQQKFFPSRFQFELRFGDSSRFRYLSFLFLRPLGIFLKGLTLLFRDLRIFVGRS